MENKPALKTLKFGSEELSMNSHLHTGIILWINLIVISLYGISAVMYRFSRKSSWKTGTAFAAMVFSVLMLCGEQVHASAIRAADKIYHVHTSTADCWMFTILAGISMCFWGARLANLIAAIAQRDQLTPGNLEQSFPVH